MRPIAAYWLLVVVLAAQTAPPAIQTTSLPPFFIGKSYYQHLEASGGVTPLHWRISNGKLPPGISLDTSGLLTGIPTTAGEYRFTVAVTDSARPPRTATREFSIVIPAALSISWAPAPRVENGAIVGGVEVGNAAGERLDLTVIVVAVNEIGKAFALGYQRYQQRTVVQTISFGSTLPSGNYIVHADAIGESASSGAVYRARLQTPQPLRVP